MRLPWSIRRQEEPAMLSKVEQRVVEGAVIRRIGELKHSQK